MSLVCEISGEPIVGKDEAVVTPSGHVCLKRLLLTKLMENGGMDPFHDARPLTEDQLVTLNLMQSVAKPKPMATSMPSLLQTMQNEYDALVLELFDTRKALEETRRELSQALYQNDAAIRVVARVSQEKDTIQQQLEQWKASASTNANVAAPAAAAAEPSPNKRRRIETTEVLENDLPDQDIAQMSDVWAQLNKVRKPTLKAAASEAPSPKDMAKMAFLETKAWHKSTNKGIPCLATSTADGLTVTAGKDKQLVVYDETNKVVKHTFVLKEVATAAAIGKGLVVAGTKSGSILAYFLSDDNNEEPTSSSVVLKSQSQLQSAICHVSVHPTGQHVVACTSDGRVIVCIAQDGQLQQVASFSAAAAASAADSSKETYTCAALHPDGLIYVAGTSTGKLHVWDFKNKALAATLQDGDAEDAVSAIAISNNGYHIGVGHASATLKFWDLRKQKVVATLDNAALGSMSIQTVAFDKAGKYAAFGGKGGIRVTTIKEWGTTASLETKNPVSGIVWSSSSSLAVSCDGERSVQLFGVPSVE